MNLSDVLSALRDKLHLLDANNPALGLADLPAGGDPAKRLQLLARTWHELQLSRDADVLRPYLAALREKYEEHVGALLATLERVLLAGAAELEAGLTDDKLALADVPPGAVCYFQSPHFPFWLKEAVGVYVHRLPAGHPFRSLLRAEELLTVSGEPVLALGSSELAVFDRDRAVRFTRGLRDAQDDAERQRRLLAEAEQRYEEEARRQSRSNEQRIAELEAQVARLSAQQEPPAG